MEKLFNKYIELDRLATEIEEKAQDKKGYMLERDMKTVDLLTMQMIEISEQALKQFNLTRCEFYNKLYDYEQEVCHD